MLTLRECLIAEKINSEKCRLKQENSMKEPMTESRQLLLSPLTSTNQLTL